MLYRIAEAAANGWAFAGSLQTVQGNVLIIQKDESDSNGAQKNQNMRLQMLRPLLNQDKWNSALTLGCLKSCVSGSGQHKAKYVLMDSMVSLFGGGLDLSEGEIGCFYVHLLKAKAAEDRAHWLHCADPPHSAQGG